MPSPAASNEPSLTIVVPTRRRGAFVGRLLRYWAHIGCAWPIILADEGAPEDREASAAVVGEHAARLTLLHLFNVGPCDFVTKVYDALARVTTPYVVLGADDDFFSPAGLAAAVNWLEAHGDYSVAHGRSIGFHVAGADGVHGRMHTLYRYPQSSVEQETALARLEAHLRNYCTTWYSVQRTAQVVENYRLLKTLDVDVRFCELLPSYLAVARGKGKKLPEFYMARQMHQQQGSSTMSETWFDWVVSPGFARQYEAFCDAVLRVAAETESVDVERGRREVRDAFRHFVYKHLAKDIATIARRANRDGSGRLPKLIDPHVVARRLGYLASLAKPASEDVRAARASGDYAQIEAAVRGQPLAV